MRLKKKDREEKGAENYEMRGELTQRRQKERRQSLGGVKDRLQNKEKKEKKG